ncbi:hypothetical protein L484_003841 [Morus notabilis]|uniref:UDP-N-acetylglucosamine transferase subunit ALG14 n=1 Tax=Morus notabilis TaxID=981085 RepID=W9QZI2_9ROSA|nr:hypothetical protein L484_003841 [Morus notabilis]
MSSVVAIALYMVGVVVALVRLVYVLCQTGKPLKVRGKGDSRLFRTLIVLGSGGHTAEMLNLLAVLQKERFAPRYYIAAATDNMSLEKARSFENSLASETGHKLVGTLQFMQIYRSREVGQSYITSVWTTLVAMAHSLWLMIRVRPEVIIAIQWSSIFYVESIARVQRLSLSGLILYKLRIADQFFVQWPQLQRKYPRAHYVGCLM